MTIAPAAVKALLAYPWPGNVRELRNVVERAMALCDTEAIGVDDLPAQVKERRSTDLPRRARSRAA